ncbi:conjugal transfer protein TraF [Zhongshania aliphaticivorans]|uniref:conjugal transfer protein TraF n=1 Tax=Zhongshania aliphaticivorans TaxID=1470434 RepID=UPI0012E659B8|nr:conjugal transfer protein TraF [Zhongshania aliphaticivorans]CAA0115409.1 Uncharacterised protein [Zhongshania aliphaticivorans]
MSPLLQIRPHHLFSLLLLAAQANISTATELAPPDDGRLQVLHSRYAAFPAHNHYSDTSLQGDGYAFINDNDELIDTLKNIYDEGLALQGRSRGLLVIPGDEVALVEQLKNAANDKTSFAAGGHFALLTKHKNWIIVGGSEFTGSGRFIYDEDDATRLRFATVVGLFSFGQLQSHMDVSALWTNYLGVNHRFNFEAMPNTRFGITTKIQNISVIERSISVSEYEEGKLFDRSRDVENNIQLNADLGIEHHLGPWTLGLQIDDIYQQNIKGVEGTRYQQRSRISSNIIYTNSWNSLRLSADLTPQKGFGELSSRRHYELSTTLPVSNRVDILLGYQWFDSENDSNLPSAGLRYRLGELLRIDAQFSYAGPREFGGGVSLQLPL